MESKLRIGIVGAGSFAPFFIPLFQKHPAVEGVWVTDHKQERMDEMVRRFGCQTIPAFESMLDSPQINAVALFVPRHLHGPLALQALQAGKHVYSAVPMGNTLEECKAIVDTVRATRLTYMMGETCYYYPCACWCRQQHRQGAFGKPVYVASQYYHDLDGFEYPRLGEGWQKVAGLPPMLYPTHSFSMALSTMDAHVTKVSCMGYRDTEEDQVFGPGLNLWDNPFSCEVALAQLSNGAVARVSEFRRVGVHKPSSYISTFIGTRGAYECSLDRHLYQRKTGHGLEEVSVQDVSDQVNPADVTAAQGENGFLDRVANDGFSNNSPAPCQPQQRLPDSFRGLPNGHMGTHQLLVDDFCRAASTGALPPLNAWFAARVNLPGLIAHQSAMQGGITLDVPDLGDPPGDWERLDAFS